MEKISVKQWWAEYYKGGPGSGNWEAPGQPRYAHEGADKRNHTDEQLTKKIHDDRLLNSIYEKNPDFSKMTVDDRLRFMEMNSIDSKGMGLVNPEFAFKEYDFSLRDKIPKNLSADELRNYLKEKNLVTELDKKPYTFYPKIHLEERQLIDGLSESQKDEFVEKFPATFKSIVDAKRFPVELWPGRDKLSIGQYERMSDLFGKVSGKEGFKNPNNIYEDSIDIQKMRLGTFSLNKEVALTKMLSGWANMGGGTESQLIMRDLSSKQFPINRDISFYNGRGVNDAPKDASFYSLRLVEHIKALKQETEQFYKNELATKKNPDPDLSIKVIDIYRGVGGHPEAYTPAAVESWSTQKSSANKFGVKMATSGGSYREPKKYSLLSGKITLDKVLWSYKSVQGKYGWPPEKELKGKKEFAVLGGSFKDSSITMEKFNV
jgi:hypothetical protein